MPTVEELLAKSLDQNAELAAQNREILARLVNKENGGAEMFYKAPANFATNTPLHGSAGIFSGPGLDRNVITAHIRPSGLGGMLPLIASVDEDPRFASLTGYTAVSGSQPTDVCDNAPTGYVKGCNLSARFGRIRFDTQTIDIGAVMRRVNRGDFTDLMLRGRILNRDLGPQDIKDEGQVLNIITQSEMVTVGVAFEREVGRQLWQGTPAVANEFPGLDLQIATGQVDADTNTACPALDSDVKNYGYRLLDSTIVSYIAMLETYLHHNADRMGLLPVQWVLTMRPELWQELSAIWPCAYYTNRCASYVESGGTTFIDGREMVGIRDQMRKSMTIEVNGRTYPVVTDTGIFEHNNVNNANCEAGEYASSIYFVPMTIQGNYPVTYREHVNYSLASKDLAYLTENPTFWTDGGAYSWAMEQVKWCFLLAARTEQRVILRTPQLAGRLDAVKYAPMQHLRDPYPESPYFADGGVSLRTPIGDPYGTPWA